METRNRTLLPSGIYDHIAPEAALHRTIGDTLLSSFERFGYDYTSPPLVEYESSLLFGTGASLAPSTFRLADPLSSNMLGIRSDITVQIARIATSRLQHMPAPLRLSYLGDVLRSPETKTNHERQLTQAGIELIGTSTLEADAEVVRVAIHALQALGVKKLSVDFHLPRLRDILLTPLKLNTEDRQALEDAIAKKDPKLIRHYGGNQTELLLTLVSPTTTLETLLTLSLPKEGKALCKDLNQVVTSLSKALPDVTLTVDPLESRGSSYHSGIGFSIFARHAKDEIGRGGRYHIPQANGKATDAVGCTLYTNALHPLLPAAKPAKRVLITPKASEAEAAKLRAQGCITVYALSDKKEWPAEAKRLRCNDII